MSQEGWEEMEFFKSEMTLFLLESKLKCSLFIIPVI